MLFAALVNPALIPIPYRIYQPKRAGNLPIPANPPVNKWDATLLHSHHHHVKIDTVRLGSICDAQFGGKFSATPTLVEKARETYLSTESQLRV